MSFTLPLTIPTAPIRNKKRVRPFPDSRVPLVSEPDHQGAGHHSGEYEVLSIHAPSVPRGERYPQRL
jgi:hypothetical protein